MASQACASIVETSASSRSMAVMVMRLQVPVVLLDSL